MQIVGSGIEAKCDSDMDVRTEGDQRRPGLSVEVDCSSVNRETEPRSHHETDPDH